MPLLLNVHIQGELKGVGQGLMVPSLSLAPKK